MVWFLVIGYVHLSRYEDSAKKKIADKVEQVNDPSDLPELNFLCQVVVVAVGRDRRLREQFKFKLGLGMAVQFITDLRCLPAS